MAYPSSTKTLARVLRRRGYSVKEIANKLDISASTSSLWSRDVTLNNEAQERLNDRRIIGQHKAISVRQENAKVKNVLDQSFAKATIKSIKFNKNINLLCCALLYWAEGSKTEGLVSFTNSDPKMIATFLDLFRKSFVGIDESKFRCLIHIHEYHDDKEIKKYWSLITDIPVSQFYRSYLKPHTGHRKKVNYQGTLSLRYRDRRVVQKLKAIYNTFSTHIGV